jgi:hypothetical protein
MAAREVKVPNGMEFEARKFTSDEEMTEIGEGLLSRSLPKAKWTHEAHFAAVIYLLRRRPDVHLVRELPRIIASYNEASGGMNTDTSGYHETLTQLYIRLVRAYLRNADPSAPLFEVCNQLTASPRGHRDFPLGYFSKNCLFSVAARKGWVEPDLRPFDFE